VLNRMAKKIKVKKRCGNCGVVLKGWNSNVVKGIKIRGRKVYVCDKCKEE